MSNSDLNIGWAFHSIATSVPDRPAVIAPDLTISYGNLWRVTEAYGLSMREHGVCQGDVLALDTSDTIIASVVCLAAALLGATYVPYGPDIFGAKGFTVDHILRSSERPVVRDQAIIEIDASWSPKYRQLPTDLPAWPGFGDAHQCAWILPSSGTTGRAKFVALSPQMVSRRVAAIASEFGRPGQRCLTLFPAGSRPFVVRAMAALTSGQTLVDARSVDFMIEVGTQVVFASPHQIDTFMQGRSVHPKIPLLQVSGTLISANHLATYLESFEAVEDVYGTNETIKAQIIRYAYDGSAIVANLKPSDAVLQIVDTEDAPVGIGEQGQIRIQSPYMANGYLGEPKATQRHFKGGWFYPGDFGCVEADGRIKLLGRSGDVINIGGEKLLLSDLNNALLAVPSVRDGICLQNPLPNHHEELLAIVELLSTVVPKYGARECWEAMAKEFGVGLAPSKVLTVQRFPRTADGAIRRGLMRDLLTEALISGAPEQTKLFEFEISSDA